MPLERELVERAKAHAALGEPHRLAIVELLRRSDYSSVELGRLLGIASNLVAHHVSILKEAGLIAEVQSSGDRRRWYLRLLPQPLAAAERTPRLAGILFVCTQNSARSQLAAALFTRASGHHAKSAGTHPAGQVHPLAVATAARHGLDLRGARPRALAEVRTRPKLIVTVCDQAHEELGEGPTPRLHWSVPDPAAVGTRRAFEESYMILEQRVARVLGRAA